jgi:short subunit dehydrogenase-like uncharacterized protein
MKNVLLYGANGFSGRLIAQAARARWGIDDAYRLVLSGRNFVELQSLACSLNLPERSVHQFSLDEQARVNNAVGAGFDAVINAAGPFRFTAAPLVRAALRHRVPYFDINGEADVYKRLDDFAYFAAQREVPLVSGAGHCAATSDLMLRTALKRLKKRGIARLGTVRIAYSHLLYVSRGSAQTAWRSIRDQAMVARPGRQAKRGQQQGSDTFCPLVLDYEPTGRIERMFDFGDAALLKRRDQLADDRKPVTRRIAMAANLLDLLTARIAINQAKIPTQRIEAYIEMPEGARVFVQWNAMASLLNVFPGWRRWLGAAVDMLPEGPTKDERRVDRHTVLLQIDDGEGRTLVDWRVETPDPYEFTAQCVLAAVEGLQHRSQDETGWLTPGQLIRPSSPDPLEEGADWPLPDWPLPGCRSELRTWEIL